VRQASSGGSIALKGGGDARQAIMFGMILASGKEFAEPLGVFQIGRKPLIFGRLILLGFTFMCLTVAVFVWPAKPFTPVQFRAWPPLIKSKA
jgi:hypothetical protein